MSAGAYACFSESILDLSLILILIFFFSCCYLLSLLSLRCENCFPYSTLFFFFSSSSFFSPMYVYLDVYLFAGTF